MPTNPGTTGLVAWWALGEASGTRVDSHGDNDAIVEGGSPGSRTGKVGDAVDITATAWLGVPTSHTDISIGAGESATFGGWMRFDSLPAFSYPLARWDGSGNWGLQTQSTGVVTTFVATGAGTATANSGASAVATSAWHFITGWHDHTAGANGTIYLQVDNGTVFSTALAATIAGGGSALRTFIGSLNDGGFGSMDGGVDEAFFYARVLTSDERDWLYNAGAGRSYADLTASAALGLPVLAHHHRQVWG